MSKAPVKIKTTSKKLSNDTIGKIQECSTVEVEYSKSGQGNIKNPSEWNAQLRKIMTAANGYLQSREDPVSKNLVQLRTELNTSYNKVEYISWCEEWYNILYVTHCNMRSAGENITPMSFLYKILQQDNQKLKYHIIKQDLSLSVSPAAKSDDVQKKEKNNIVNLFNGQSTKSEQPVEKKNLNFEIDESFKKESDVGTPPESDQDSSDGELEPEDAFDEESDDEENQGYDKPEKDATVFDDTSAESKEERERKTAIENDRLGILQEYLKTDDESKRAAITKILQNSKFIDTLPKEADYNEIIAGIEFLLDDKYDITSKKKSVVNDLRKTTFIDWLEKADVKYDSGGIISKGLNFLKNRYVSSPLDTKLKNSYQYMSDIIKQGRLLTKEEALVWANNKEVIAKLEKEVKELKTENQGWESQCRENMQIASETTKKEIYGKYDKQVIDLGKRVAELATNVQNFLSI